MEHLTAKEAKEIVAEIDAYNHRHVIEGRPPFRVRFLTQLDLPVEAYEVVYTDDYSEKFYRNDAGQLEAAQEQHYAAPDWTPMKGLTK